MLGKAADGLVVGAPTSASSSCCSLSLSSSSADCSLDSVQAKLERLRWRVSHTRSLEIANVLETLSGVQRA